MGPPCKAHGAAWDCQQKYSDKRGLTCWYDGASCRRMDDPPSSCSKVTWEPSCKQLASGFPSDCWWSEDTCLPNRPPPYKTHGEGWQCHGKVSDAPPLKCWYDGSMCRRRDSPPLSC